MVYWYYFIIYYDFWSGLSFISHSSYSFYFTFSSKFYIYCVLLSDILSISFIYYSIIPFIFDISLSLFNIYYSFYIDRLLLTVYWLFYSNIPSSLIITLSTSYLTISTLLLSIMISLTYYYSYSLPPLYIIWSIYSTIQSIPTIFYWSIHSPTFYSIYSTMIYLILLFYSIAYIITRLNTEGRSSYKSSMNIKEWS